MDKLSKALSAPIMAALLTVAAPSSAATMLSVNWGEGCGKTTCFDNSGVYTRTFSARDFSGPVSISQLLMQRGVLGALDDATFRISFQLNGAELGTWGRYNMAGIGGDQLGFSGQDVVWNPEDGDLVLVLALDPAPKVGGGGAFFASAPDESGPLGGGSTLEEPFGLGEQPGGDPPAGRPSGVGGAVPEPSTWALLIGGFGLVGAALRRRRLVASLQPCR